MNHKSLLEQLAEQEAKKQDEAITEKATLMLLEELVSLGVNDETQVTVEIMLKATTNVTRKNIYRKFPATPPMVVEALLLMRANLLEDLFKDVGRESMSDVLIQEMQNQTLRFGRALEHTIKALNQMKIS